jgi:filamentous hemagglutinin
VDGDNSGANTFTGTVTIAGASGSFTSANNSAYSFVGGIANAGNLNLSGTGTVTFTNNQTMSGAGAFQFENFTVPATRTLIVSATGTKTVSGDVTNAGTISHTAVNGTLNFGGTLTTSGTLTGGAAPINVVGTLNNSGTVNGGAGSLTIGVYTASGNFTNGAGGSTVTGAVTLSGTANINMNSGNFSALSTTTLSGTSTITDGNNSGSNLFAGLLTVGSGCSFSSSSNSPYDFRGGIQHDGSSFSLTGTGAITFTTNNQTLSGASAMTLNNATVTGINLTNSLTSGVTITSTCTGSNSSSQWIQGSNGILNFQGTNLMPTGVLNAGSSVNTVNYNSNATQNILGTTYYNLGCLGSGTITKTLTQNLICGNDLTINAGVTFQAAAYNVIANNIINSGIFAKSGGGSVFAGGVVTLNGTGSFSSMSGNPSLEFQGGIVQNSSVASNFGTGTVVFSLNNQNISGSGAGSLIFGGGVILNDDVYVSNQKTVNITGNLDAVSGSSYWNNDNGSVLNYAGAQVPFSTAGSLQASTNSNTVNYNGASQTIMTASYFNLGILGLGTKTMSDVTVSGSFSHTAGTLNASGTQTFTGGSAATITTSSTTLNNVLLSKPGSSLTLAGNLTVANLLTLTSGTLAFGSVARTLTVKGDLSGSGTIDMSGIAGNSLVLSGANNTLGTYTSAAGNTVTYNRAGPQTIFSSPNYRRVSLGGSGTKSPAGDISVSDTLYFTADVLMGLGSSNLTLNPGTRIRALTGTSAFGVNRMILTGGSGSIIRRGTSTTDFTGFCWSSAGRNGLFPVGTTGFYSPCEITALSATIAGTASISVNAIATKLPTVPFYFNSLNKYWELSSTNLSAISANMRFTYNNPAEVVGIQTLYRPRVWDGSSLSAPAGPSRSEERRVGKECATLCRSRWSPSQ